MEDYRKLTRIKALQVEEVQVKELLEENVNLLQKEFQKVGVELRMRAEPQMTIAMDRKLIDQVLINLLTNARHATEGRENALVELHAYSSRNISVIEVKDNGIGIDGAEGVVGKQGL